MKVFPSLLLVLLALLTGLCACRGLQPAPPVRELSADQLLFQLKARQAGATAFAARGRLTLLSPQQNATGNAILRGQLPENLAVDLKDPLGRAVLSFATNGQVVDILFPRENKLLRGPATPPNLAAFIPRGVSLDQTLRLLLAALPLSDGPPSRLHYDPQEKHYVLEWLNSAGALQERLWVAAAGVWPQKEEWYGPDGRLAFQAEWGDYDRLIAGRPQHLKLTAPEAQVELRLAYREFTPNPSLDPAAFTVPHPPGVKVLPLKP